MRKLALHIGFILILAGQLQSTAKCEVKATVAIMSEADRNGMRQRVAELRQRLDPLRIQPGISLDRWADADVFLKGVTWALDFEADIDAKTQQKLTTALRRASERIDALLQGKTPWIERRGSSVRGFVSVIDGSTQPYGLVIPASYDPSKPIRLDVVLHGSRRATGMGELQFMEGFDRGDSPETKPVPKVDYIEVHPLGRMGENAYRFEGETDVDEAIEAVGRQFKIDRRRIVLRGGSLGGVGTWQLGLKRPDRWVALGPAAGPVDTYVFAGSAWKHFVRLDPLTPWQKTMLHLVDAIDYTANAGMVPVVAAMGDKDPYFTSHQLIESAFKKEGVLFVGVIAPGAGHSLTPKALQEQLRLVGEYAARGTDPRPKKIRFVTWTLKFSRCHWVEILGLDAHYRRAEIQAELADDGSVVVSRVDNITRFALLPPALEKSSAKVTIGNSKINLPPVEESGPRTFVFERRQGTWVCAGAMQDVKLVGKRPGLQGPIDDAFATPFLCIRGTGKAWNPAVGAWADASLKRFAYEWRRHYRGELPLKNDVDVTPEDLRRYNLILFGDPGSNRWINQIAGQLDVPWTRDQIQLKGKSYPAATHGLQLISPNPLPGANGHYVVFNSGHTYHDLELRFSYMVFPRLGDWAISKVGETHADKPVPTVSETILDSGFFDEAWKLPR